MVVKVRESAGIQELAKGKSISKVCAVLMTLTHRSPLRLNEIADAAGLNRVTALRILDELCEARFLIKLTRPPRYGFGPEVIAMVAAASRSFNLGELTRPSLLRIADQTGDTALLHIRAGSEALVVDKVFGSYPIRANFLDVGSRRPLGVGGGSMALLAWLPAAEREAILDITARHIDQYPKMSRTVLQEHIDAAQEVGHVIMTDIVIEKMAAIGYPLRNQQGSVIGSISIVALSERISEREAVLADLLSKEAAVIERMTSA